MATTISVLSILTLLSMTLFTAQPVWRLQPDDKTDMTMCVWFIAEKNSRCVSSCLDKHLQILFQLHIIRPARSSARWPRVIPALRYVYMSHENNMTRSPRENYSLGKELLWLLPSFMPLNRCPWDGNGVIWQASGVTVYISFWVP